MTRPALALAGLALSLAACAGDETLQPDLGQPPAAEIPGIAPAGSPSAPTAAAVALPACTHHWAAAANGSWFDPTRWLPATVPGAASTACLDAAGTYTVTLDPANDASRSMSNGLSVGGGASGTQTLALAGTAALLNVGTGIDVKPNGAISIPGFAGMVVTAGAVSNAGSSGRCRSAAAVARPHSAPNRPTPGTCALPPTESYSTRPTAPTATRERSTSSVPLRFPRAPAIPHSSRSPGTS